MRHREARPSRSGRGWLLGPPQAAPVRWAAVASCVRNEAEGFSQPAAGSAPGKTRPRPASTQGRAILLPQEASHKNQPDWSPVALWRPARLSGSELSGARALFIGRLWKTFRSPRFYWTQI